MLKSEQKTINGNLYEVTQLPYSQGHKLLLRLYKVLGPTVGKAIAASPELEVETLASMSVLQFAPAFSAAVEQLAGDLGETDFGYAVDTLSEYSFLVDDKGHKRKLSDVREFHFAGNYLELFQWLAFAIKVNFLGFTGGRDMLAAVLARAQAVKAPSPSPSGLTGASTESPAPSDTPDP